MAKQQVSTHFTTNGVFSPPPPFSSLKACSFGGMVHYAFDMAQQVHYPSNPLQPGPIYFLTPRKCALFGVCCESIPRQINYLIDEACDTGKGANTIISLLHHFFEVHGLGESAVHLHADNCVGQNKNNTMLQYLLWRTLVGLHVQITLSFLIVGHTKFSPDWCFGLLKQRFRRTNVSCLDDIAAVVDRSASVNVPQLVGTQEGEMLVPSYNWAEMFAPHLRKLKNIKSYQHFRFDSSTPGVVHFRHTSDSEEDRVDLRKNLSWSPSATDLPQLIDPTGLSLERQWYLYNNISEYCTELTRDKVCPKPSAPVESATATMPAATMPATSYQSSPRPPPAKKQRLCSKCKKPGHNARNCGQ